MGEEAPWGTITRLGFIGPEQEKEGTDIKHLPVKRGEEIARPRQLDEMALAKKHFIYGSLISGGRATRENCCVI